MKKTVLIILLILGIIGLVLHDFFLTLFLYLFVIYWIFRFLIWLKRKIFWKVRNRLILLVLLMGGIPLILWSAIFAGVFYLSLNNVSNSALSGFFEYSVFTVKQMGNQYIKHIENGTEEDFKHNSNLNTEYVVYNPQNGFIKNETEMLPEEAKQITENAENFRNKMILTVKSDNVYLMDVLDYYNEKKDKNWLITFTEINDDFTDMLFDSTKIAMNKIRITYGRGDTSSVFEQPVSIRNELFQRSGLYFYENLRDTSNYIESNSETDKNAVKIKFTKSTNDSLEIHLDEVSVEKTYSTSEKLDSILPFFMLTNLRNTLFPKRHYFLHLEYEADFDAFFDNSPMGIQIVILIVIVSISILLLFIAELVLFIMSLIIIRRISKSLYHLTKGTKEVQKGNFDYSVAVLGEDELGQMAQSFNYMIANVAKLLETEKEKEILQRELEIAATVQQTLFISSFPHYDDCEIYAKCLPARKVGGDYYDVIKINENCIDFLICDVSGKGISASLMMANLHSAIHSILRRYKDISVKEMVTFLNVHFYENSEATKYATFFYGRILRDEKKLIYCNAGHNPPILLKNNVSARLTEGGTVIGMFPEAEYEESVEDMSGETTLFLFTDGISEAENQEEDQFGEERIEIAVENMKNLTPEEITKKMIETVKIWTEPYEAQDDQTLVVIKIKNGRTNE